MKKYTTITPDFLGLGVPRAGTTWIHKCLEEHPEVSVPKTKYLRYHKAILADDPHLLFNGLMFSKDPTSKKVGSVGSNIFFVIGSEIFLKRHFPDITLFICLRNPIDRAYSNFLFEKAKDSTDECHNEDFDQYVKHANAKSQYVQRRLFCAERLSAYMHTFGPEQFKIFLYDDLQRDPAQFIRQLYSWVGVDPSYIPSHLHQKINPTVSSRLRVPFLLTQRNKRRLRCYLERVLGKSFMQFMRDKRITKPVSYLFRKNEISSYRIARPEQHPPAMKKETRTRLHEWYRKDIERTSQLIDRDLSHWV